jgi:anthranilate synthase component 2
MILLLDNFDSFTYNLADYIAQSGAETNIMRNNKSLDEIKRHDYQAVILSPGPQTPEKSGNLMAVIHYYVAHLPVLGICLGHQALGVYFGARLVKAHQPMHGKISSITCSKDYLFKDIPRQMQVVRYHSLILEQLTEPLEIIATTTKQEVMGLKHKYLPVRGVQFHPEAALTLHGLKMIENWLKFNKIVD